MESKIIILGLGNPGAEYENTYHNVGALAVRALAEAGSESDADQSPHWETHKKLFSYRSAPNQEFIIPLVFMNESGLAAKEALKKFNAAPEDLIVIHDDSDLPIGDFKISRGQSSAGHKGVQSIIDHLGTQDFQRVRIGIRGERTEDGGQRKKAGDFVLSQITPDDREILATVFKKIAEKTQASSAN